MYRNPSTIPQTHSVKRGGRATFGCMFRPICATTGYTYEKMFMRPTLSYFSIMCHTVHRFVAIVQVLVPRCGAHAGCCAEFCVYDVLSAMRSGPFGTVDRFDPGPSLDGSLSEPESRQGFFERSISLFR